ncbi:phosphatidylinositol-glycan biosynthesis class F protein isoform X2 [Erinaceus europaeus]|uniref:Phosphatidylinositol-glycan biosynthesis class F protein isoform X2 n=1 Tax=Erinaceus europaeus TaxID=9365 RepID=A0ABM3X3X6_ERIEU|nr:phosphatidylinositol-glycan biosynthesis class F protein isoform X2 [Erinaceus europaeus]XP_060043522.1 phosphatidylinositol-glycan biosynthesis class F protein isoform X2 [Erinaceus europaeus]XP_060043523.1 phosphatidylinositol-glycan biosynthesis class F protein isoform X2 [Erinaceus europaeus]
MKDTDIKRLLYTHLLCIFSIILSIFIPSLFLENFSVLETHLTWLCICSVFVTAINLILYLVVKPNTPSKRSSLSYKVTRFLKCCIYFLLSCFFFHIIFVLYGAPLIELVLETFSFAVILSTFTTVPCLCLLGPNIKAWLRVFSRNGYGPSPARLEQPLATWLALLFHHSGYTGIESNLHTRTINLEQEERIFLGADSMKTAEMCVYGLSQAVHFQHCICFM